MFFFFLLLRLKKNINNNCINTPARNPDGISNYSHVLLLFYFLVQRQFVFVKIYRPKV